MRLAYPVTAAVLLATAAVASSPPEWTGQARSAAASLGSALMPELNRALTGDGPIAAVEVCNVRAPQIAAGINRPGLEIGRTALRVRNAANAPDEWERETLRHFKARLADGADPASLEAWTTATVDGRKLGRWMKAIPTAPLCITCHGETIAPELARTIEQLYPEDQATGFEVGQLRGAFTATMDLSGHD